jgi:hypothetical protein
VPLGTTNSELTSSWVWFDKETPFLVIEERRRSSQNTNFMRGFGSETPLGLV